MPIRLQNAKVAQGLTVLLGLGSAYLTYRTVMWSLVYLRLKASTSIKRRLDDGTIQRQDRNGLASWTWELVEWYAGSVQKSKVHDE